ncbi:MAG: hypothetical protein QOD55_684 [Solirubrobacteraceae bacterium]|jgi:uncharacterized protein GlcG (DUF336 family)|nr:hypothetical protein [Solirubrobacteraceae bacterium]
MTELTLADAQRVIDAALERAREIDVAVSVAIVDAGREPLAFARMDGALLVSIETAQGKAYTARSLNRATGQISPDTLPGHPLYGLEVTGSQPFVTFGGGDVLRVGEDVVGAVGVAGGTIAQDEDILAAALVAMANAAAA